jgi:hypothetical protein
MSLKTVTNELTYISWSKNNQRRPAFFAAVGTGNPIYNCQLKQPE